MGEVYRARDTRLERTVAIKVLPAHLAATRSCAQRFEREARAISSSHHPHICALHDVGQEDGTDYLVMEYLDGETLADRLAKGPLPLEQVLRFGIEIADALDRAHRQRDRPSGPEARQRDAHEDGREAARLRPREAAVAAAPTLGLPTATAAALTDGGRSSARSVHGARSSSRARRPTRAPTSSRSARVLYEMATGRARVRRREPGAADRRDPVSDPPPISSSADDAAALDRVVQTCLAKDPDDRWQNAHDVDRELRWIARERASRGGPQQPSDGKVAARMGGGTAALSPSCWSAAARRVSPRFCSRNASRGS